MAKKPLKTKQSFVDWNFKHSYYNQKKNKVCKKKIGEVTYNHLHTNETEHMNTQIYFVVSS